ncbi:MAG TPA: PKD domain-containing protein, partial [Candidatus Hydrogenedentes bacterium]|nr:PKD domain-containing protein [Candidatus Hydrogenedentota bacterium]
VDSPDGAGGLAGACNQSDVGDCFAMGAVSGDNAGGLIGLSSDASIINCSSTGFVDFLTSGGGLIGVDDPVYPSTVTDCFWDMDSSNAGASQGGIGKTTAEMIQALTFTNWNFTDIWAIDEGLGYPWLQTLPLIGPAASFYISVEDGEAPLEVAFTNNSFPGTYVNSVAWAWDFGDGASSTEQYPSNHTYTDTGTYTITLTMTTPIGTSSDSRQIVVYLGIQTLVDLNAIRDYPGEIYWLLNDIDASGIKFSEGWAPIPDFTGEFDGNGYTISNLTVNRPSETYGGLFGQTGSGAYIHDLNMQGGSISATRAGAIAGSLYAGNISRCGSKGVNVQGSEACGGIAGEVFGEYEGIYPTVFRCYATGPVTSSNASAGGLIGYTMYCNVEQCFATGPVTASLEAGGLVGSSYDSCTFNSCFALGNVTCSSMYGGGFIGAVNRYLTFTDCFCTGSVSGAGSPLGGFISFGVASCNTFDHCFWSQENSGLTWSWDATDLVTTAAMTQQTNYTGWDFSGTGVWDIEEGVSYPWLRWFGPVIP